MSGRRSTRSASIDSHDMHGDTDLELDDASNGPVMSKRKGKGKATAKESDRKVQNRIAQREFRQRKQAYIKELEAKVKLQEMGRDEQIERLNDGIKTLLNENLQLRQLLAGLSGFIGEGLGGSLHRLGTTLPAFESLISRSKLDEATDALRLDGIHVSPTSEAGPSFARPTASQSYPPPPPPQPNQPESSSIPRPMHHSTYPPPTSHPVEPPLSSRSAPETQPLPTPPRSNAPPSRPTSSSTRPRDDSKNVNDDRDRLPSSRVSEDTGGNLECARQYLEQIGADNLDVIDEDIVRQTCAAVNSNAMQALQLISYHMKSKRDYPDYNLPPSLKATATQQLVPHSSFFDGIIFASLRDRLILLKDQYSLKELSSDLITGLHIHGNDMLLAENWELSENFLRKFWFVIDETVLSISNHWRKERGDPELTMKDLVPDNDK